MSEEERIRAAFQAGYDRLAWEEGYIKSWDPPDEDEYVASILKQEGEK